LLLRSFDDDEDGEGGQKVEKSAGSGESNGSGVGAGTAVSWKGGGVGSIKGSRKGGGLKDAGSIVEKQRKVCVFVCVCMCVCL